MVWRKSGTIEDVENDIVEEGDATWRKQTVRMPRWRQLICLKMWKKLIKTRTRLRKAGKTLPKTYRRKQPSSTLH